MRQILKTTKNRKYQTYSVNSLKKKWRYLTSKNTIELELNHETHNIMFKLS